MKTGENSVPDPRRVLIGVALIALLHCALWFAHYNQTALGESPALDNRQTLELARAMAEGTLAEEPFHRAPLYPYILSLFLSTGLPYELLPLLARWLNAFALAIIAASTSWIALQLWGRTACGWAAGLLVALNPVLLFFAGDAFDILLASAPLLLSAVLLQTWIRKPSLRLAFIIGVLLALGGALRSHILPLALIWPFAACCLAERDRLTQGLLSALPVLISFLLLGFANLHVSGEFRLMPWQGAYNLWAGNRPDASGRIYAQKMRVDFDGSYDNPAKLESIALYEQETGEDPPHSIDAMNAFWKQKTFEHITEHPIDWLSLMSRKAYYFLNSYEQYDNKTYSFHKQRHTLLHWNPIHWGALLLLAVAGALIGLRDKKTRPLILASIVIFALYAAGTILFYTSNRFRLPMVPVLSILAAGLFTLRCSWKTAGRHWKASLVGCLLLTALITYSGYFDARKKDTWIEDMALLANASLRTGLNDEAIEWAEQALTRTPSRSDMRTLIVQAKFNQWALANPPADISVATAQKYLTESRAAAQTHPDLLSLVGVYEWKLGLRDSAEATWGRTAQDEPFARICLFWTEVSPPPKPAEMKLYERHKDFSLLSAAILAHKQGIENQVSKTLNHILKPVADTP